MEFDKKVLQVSGSLNSSYCYILQTGKCIFTWIGSLSSTRDHEILDRMVEMINVSELFPDQVGNITVN